MLYILSCMILILLFTKTAYTQERIPLEGKVYDLNTDMPLSGAHILIVGSSYGTISGPDGSFRLSVISFPVVLKVTHIGYEERQFTIEEDFHSEELMLGIQFSAETLDAVTISDKKAELIFKDNSYSVLDFEFHENGLILLIYRNRLKMSELVLLSTLNDTLAVLSSLPGRAQALHRDCRNFIHYISYDTAYQVHFTGEELKILHPMHINVFLPVAEAFHAYHNDQYYFGIPKMYDQAIQYIRYDSVAEDYVPFRLVYNPVTLQIMMDNPSHGYMMDIMMDGKRDFKALSAGASESIDEQREKIQAARHITIEAHYLKTTVYKPLCAPLFKSPPNLVLFNHPLSRIEFLSPEGKLERATNINYHNDNDWDEKILKDEITGNYYTSYTRQNRCSIHLIDIETGQLGSANILYYPFVKKVLIRNGYVYFTYRQPGSIERTMLFRQKLRTDQDYTTVSN